MTIKYETGSIWMTTRAYIAIPVNCVGVPGAGLARQWAKRYPHQVPYYTRICAAKDLLPGSLVILDRTDRDPLTNLLLPGIVLFATKDHWMYPSRLQWIEDGLISLRASMGEAHEIISIALPKLGCGYGLLPWKDVRPLIEKYMKDCNVEVYI